MEVKPNKTHSPIYTLSSTLQFNSQHLWLRTTHSRNRYWILHTSPSDSWQTRYLPVHGSNESQEQGFQISHGSNESQEQGFQIRSSIGIHQDFKFDVIIIRNTEVDPDDQLPRCRHNNSKIIIIYQDKQARVDRFERQRERERSPQRCFSTPRQSPAFSYPILVFYYYRGRLLGRGVLDEGNLSGRRCIIRQQSNNQAVHIQCNDRR